MEISGWTIAIQAVNAVVLIWLLSRFLFTPVARIIADRQSTVDRLLKQASEACSSASADHRKVRAKLDSLALQHEDALRSSTADAEKIRQELIEQAKNEANKIIAKSSQEVVFVQKKLDSQVSRHATRLSLEITHRVLERLPAECRVTGFVKGFVDALQKLSTQERNSLASNADPLKLVSAYSLTEEEVATVRNAVIKALEKEVPIVVTEDKSLIAGLELIGLHCAVKNSFRADINRLGVVLSNSES